MRHPPTSIYQNDIAIRRFISTPTAPLLQPFALDLSDNASVVCCGLSSASTSRCCRGRRGEERRRPYGRGNAREAAQSGGRGGAFAQRTCVFASQSGEALCPHRPSADGETLQEKEAVLAKAGRTFWSGSAVDARDLKRERIFDSGPPASGQLPFSTSAVVQMLRLETG